jgi:mutator protein MutT
LVRVAVGLCSKASCWLVAQRAEHVHLGGLWEFPGGKIRRGETPEQAVVREVEEEVGVRVRPVRCLTPVCHVYADRTVELHPVLCEWIDGQPTPCQAAVAEVAWVRSEELSRLAMPEVNRRILDQLPGLEPMDRKVNS